MTRSAKVRIHVDNRSGRLKAGMFAEGEILTGVQQQAIVVPAAAVYRSEGTSEGSYVFVVENGKAVRRNVRIGRETDAKLEITEGLKPGDLLVAEQKIELADGVRVEAGKVGFHVSERSLHQAAGAGHDAGRHAGRSGHLLLPRVERGPDAQCGTAGV